MTTSGTRDAAAMKVVSLDELKKLQETIVARINKVPNGGQLFLAHPFRLLRDVGVELAPAVHAEILRLHPEISGLSDYVYDQVKSAPKQNLRIRISGLFESIAPKPADAKQATASKEVRR